MFLICSFRLLFILFSVILTSENKESIILEPSILNENKDDCPCDTLLEVNNNDPYRYQLRGTRCEGRYVQDTDADYRVTGFSFGTLNHSPNSNIDVKLAPNISGLANLRAVGLTPISYYRMDTKIRYGEVDTWKTEEMVCKVVCDKTHSTCLCNQLGIYGFVENHFGETFLPVKIMNAYNPDSLEILIAPSQPLKYVKWSILKKGNTIIDYREVPDRKIFRANDPFKIKLPANLKGDYELRVIGKHRSKPESIKTSFNIYL